ncbi:MAG TPA: hypothetical protein VF297_20610 [Pyrinomonadaceae bacterium]
MDVFTVIFVAFLGVLAFFLTVTVRREFRTRERIRRDYERQLRHPRRKR